MLELPELRRWIGAMLRLVGPLTAKGIQGRLIARGARVPLADVTRALQSMAVSGDAEKGPEGRWRLTGPLARAPALPRATAAVRRAAAPGPAPRAAPSARGAPASPLCGNGPRQRQILALLAGGALSAPDIAQEIGLPLASVYAHLSKLVARGLIERHGTNQARSFTLPAVVRRPVIEAPAAPPEGAARNPGHAPAAGAETPMREGLEKALRAVMVEAAERLAERLAERVARAIMEGDLWRE